MPLYDLSGTTSGAGTTTGRLAVDAALGGASLGNGATTANENPTHDLGGHLSGTGSTHASFQRRMIFGAYSSGSSSFIDNTAVLCAGTSSGTGTFTGGTPIIIRGLSAYGSGRGDFVISLPEHLFGVGILSAYMEVLRVPPPFCYRPHCKRQFRWLQEFQRCDLEIRVTDRRGNFAGPVFVGYTMYQVLPTGVVHQAGPTDRAPASSGVGKYYVTGLAGEGGQPGCWAVRWRTQRSFGDPVVEQYEQFEVLDAALANDPHDRTPRVRKYGWD